MDQYSPDHTPRPIPIAVPVPPGRGNSLQADDAHHHHQQYPATYRQRLLPVTDQPRPVPHPQPHPHQLYLQDFPDGGVTTDMTYTTDEDTMATTSVPPSSAGGSPNISRRAPPPHTYHEGSYRGSTQEGTYVSMQRNMSPVYAKVHKNRDRVRSLSPQHGPGEWVGPGVGLGAGAS